MEIHIRAEQLFEAMRRGRVAIYNRAFNISDEELSLLKVYPHYFWNFAENEKIEDILNDPQYERLNSLSVPLFLCGAAKITDEEYRQDLKNKIYDLIVGNENFKMYIHRYIQDFVIPNVSRQDYVDKIRQGKYKDISDYDKKRYSSLPIFKDYGGSSFNLSNEDYKDYIKK